MDGDLFKGMSKSPSHNLSKTMSPSSNKSSSVMQRNKSKLFFYSVILKKLKKRKIFRIEFTIFT